MKHLKNLTTRLTRSLALIFGCALALTSCNGKEDPTPVWDIFPINFDIEVVNKKGESLVNPNHPHTIVRLPITVEMDGKTYKLRSLSDAYNNLPQSAANASSMSRAYRPLFYGFIYRKVHHPREEWVLSFGEFDGEKNADHKIKLHWHNGTTDILRIVNSFRWVREGKRLTPEVKRQFYINGEELKIPEGKPIVYRIVLDELPSE